jgi:LuxR family quorum sensing-dependent transcriptional regulator
VKDTAGTGIVSLSQQLSRKSSLTSRENEVLQWVARGKSAWEIGEILNITKRTVDEHVQTDARKLGATNRTHAVAITLRDSLIKL